MATLSDLPIEGLVPHAGAMCLLDRLISHQAKVTVCRVTVREDSLFACPEGIPAHVGIEFMAQAIAAHGGALDRISGEPVKVGFLLGTPRMVSHVDFFKHGMTLMVEAREDWGDEELLRFDCCIRDAADGTLLQEAGLNVFQPRDLAGYLATKRSVVEEGEA